MKYILQILLLTLILFPGESCGQSTKQDTLYGNEKYIEVGADSCVYTITNTKYNGPAEVYKRYTKNNFLLPWKLYATGIYSNGFKNGAWDFMDEDSFKTATANYVNDTIRGNCSLYYPSSNKIKASGTIENCIRTGLWKSYDENGMLISECYYRNGEKDGSYIEYHPNGKIKAKGQYKQVTKKFKVLVEDPKHPGQFHSDQARTLTNVPAKTGAWTFYNENGELLSSKNYKQETETPEYLEPALKKGFYYHSTPAFYIIPDCHYY